MIAQKPVIDYTCCNMDYKLLNVRVDFRYKLKKQGEIRNDYIYVCVLAARSDYVAIGI